MIFVSVMVLNGLPLAAVFGAWVARSRLNRDPDIAHSADPTIVGRPLTDQAVAVLGSSIVATAAPILDDRLVAFVAYWVALLVLVPILG